ncbi:MAG TPA: SAM-dependent methyltransferase, partial [Acidimicrobiia bacterium]|nr:SAM-dependent methyltransferase [Acidimicrobiia bacterium]
AMNLDQRIRREIENGGPMPFERFMDLALYHPDGGFFTSGTLRSERAGDFLTSPEVSALFGETLARYVIGERERIGQPFEMVEVAAGSGSLLKPLLEAVDVAAFAVEASPTARDKLVEVLPPDRVLADLPDRIRGVVIGNELIDNLPMALAQRVDGSWRERWVGIDDDALAMVDAPPRPEVVAWLDQFAGDVPDDGWVEAQLAAASWVRDVLGRLEAGSLVLFDYGDTAENLLPRRQDGTLRTYRAHHLGPHPLDEPGGTDITADVNFTALAAVAESAGAMVELHRQDDFLTGLGLGDRLSELRHAELDAARSGDAMERLRLRSLKTEAETLLHPRGLGDFRVLVARR